MPDQPPPLPPPPPAPPMPPPKLPPTGLARQVWGAHFLASYPAQIVSVVLALVRGRGDGGGPTIPIAVVSVVAAPVMLPVQLVYAVVVGVQRHMVPRPSLYVVVALYLAVFAWGLWVARRAASRVAGSATGLCRRCGRDARATPLRCPYCRDLDPLRNT